MKDIILRYSTDFKFEDEWNVESVIDDSNGLNILLNTDESERQIHVFFDSPLSYRNTNESYLVKLWSEIEDGLLGAIFYKIENSSYRDYFDEMSLGLYKDWKVSHYAIFTSQDCIEVLSVTEPIINWHEEL